MRLFYNGKKAVDMSGNTGPVYALTKEEFNKLPGDCELIYLPYLRLHTLPFDWKSKKSLSLTISEPDDIVGVMIYDDHKYASMFTAFMLMS